MSTSADWLGGYARQADADFRAWELYQRHPEAVASECHKLLFLQMACEKLCKAYLISTKAHPQTLQTSHGFIEKVLPVIVRQQIGELLRNPTAMRPFTQRVKYLAREIELLSPSVDRDRRRPDNCEYPWDDVNGTLRSPLDWSFHPSELLLEPSGRTFLKLLRKAIDEITPHS